MFVSVIQSKVSKNFYTTYLLTIAAIVGGYVALVIIDTIGRHHYKTLCLFKAATGIPCPGCGMGRATLSIFHGHVASSFGYNILCIPFTIAVIASLFWLVRDLVVRQETFFPVISQKIKLPYKLLLLAIILADWIVNIVRAI